MLTFNKSDLAAIGQKLQEMSRKAGKATVRKAAGRAMLPVRQQAKANAPFDASTDVHVKENIAMRGRWSGDTLIIRVGVKGGAKKNTETPYWFRFKEFGTKKMPAQPFLEPALEENEQEVFDILAAQLQEALFS